MATLDHLVNKQLGQYQIMEKLGQGGMATVFKAHEQSLNRVVALKVLSPSLAENEEYIKRFNREAQSAAKLNHPNIVHIYSISEDQGYHFFAMELIKGESLADMKRSSGKISTDRILAITRQAANGLAAAHEAGLVHRDIKPANIMILADGTVKVADFGIAQVTGGETKLTMDGAVIGTPEYLSPEQCEGRPLDGRSDIYSLGVTLYELLAGKTPYQADTPVSMLMKIVKGEYPPLGSIVPDIPADIDALVNRMMATKAEKRFQTCQELIQAIDSIKTTPQTVPAADALLTMVDPQTKAVSKKGKGWLALVALLVLAIGVGAAMYYKLIPIPWQTGQSETTDQALGVAAQTTETPSEQALEQPAGETQAAGTTSGQGEPSETISNPSEQTALSQAGQETSQATLESTATTGESLGGKVSGQPSGQKDPSSANGTIPNTQGNTTAQKPTRSPNLHLLMNSDSEYSELILTSIEQKLMARGISIIRDEPDGRGPYLGLIISFKTLGVSNLEYYGKTSQQTQAFLTLSLLDMPSRKPVLAPQKQEVLYTELNVSENIEEAVDAALAGFDWQVLKEKRGL